MPLAFTPWQVAKHVLVSPTTLHLDPLVFVDTISTCCELHDVAKEVGMV